MSQTKVDIHFWLWVNMKGEKGREKEEERESLVLVRLWSSLWQESVFFFVSLPFLAQCHVLS